LLQLYSELRRHDDRKAIYLRMLEDAGTKEEALDNLITMAERDHDHARRIDLLQQLLAVKGGEEKKQVRQRLSSACLEAGQPDAAEAHLREALDLDTADAQVQMHQWCRARAEETDVPAAAAAWEEKAGKALAGALAIDADHDGALAAATEAAWRARDWTTFVDRVYRRMERGGGAGTFVAEPLRVLDALLAMPEAERQARLVGDGDVAAKERAAWLHATRGDDVRARALFIAVLESDPRRPISLHHLQQIALRSGRPEEVLAYAKRLHDVIEREYVVSADWNVRWRADQAWEEVGRWQHALGDAAAAEATWRAPSLRRSPVSSGSGGYRYDGNVPYAAERWLRWDEPERALAALEREFLMHETPPWDTHWRALAAAGRRDAAEASAWQRLLDPLRLYGVREQGRHWVWDEVSGESVPSEPSIQFLVDSYRKRGALGDLVAEVQRIAQRPETSLQAEELRRAVIAAGEDWRAKAELAEERLAEDEGNTNARIAAALCRARAGDAEPAMAHLGHVFDLASPALRQPARAAGGVRERRYETSGNRPLTIAGKKNPFSFSFQSGNSSTTWYGSSYQDYENRRPTAVVILRLAGQTAKADEVERDVIEQAPAGQHRASVCQNLGRQLARVKLYADALRLYGLARDNLGKKAGSERAWYDEQFLRLARRSGDAALRQAVLAQERARLERAVAEVAGRPGLPERQALARLLVHHRVDPQTGLTMLDAITAETGRAQDVEEPRALALRLVGRPQEAVAVHEARMALARQLRPGSYQPPKPVDQVEFGLALAAAGDAGRARAILEPALAEMRLAPRAEGENDYEYYGNSYTRAFDAELVAEVEAAVAKLGG
jgi:tetratricopeptide (TPR) repeat protein